jgi:hypothetical protein
MGAGPPRSIARVQRLTAAIHQQAETDRLGGNRLPEKPLGKTEAVPSLQLNTPMRTSLPYLAILAITGTAFAGETVVTTRYSVESCSHTQTGRSSTRNRSAGTEGAYYRSNLFRNAVILTNDTPDFMTFFVYAGDVSGPADLHSLVRTGAHVYEVVVPPYKVSFTDQRGPRYWVCSKPGKWGIDLMMNRIVAY